MRKFLASTTSMATRSRTHEMSRPASSASTGSRTTSSLEPWFEDPSVIPPWGTACVEILHPNGVRTRGPLSDTQVDEIVAAIVRSTNEPPVTAGPRWAGCRVFVPNGNSWDHIQVHSELIWCDDIAYRDLGVTRVLLQLDTPHHQLLQDALTVGRHGWGRRA